jgi:hypothetical protein
MAGMTGNGCDEEAKAGGWGMEDEEEKRGKERIGGHKPPKHCGLLEGFCFEQPTNF